MLLFISPPRQIPMNSAGESSGRRACSGDFSGVSCLKIGSSVRRHNILLNPRNIPSFRALTGPPYLGITGTSRCEPFFPSMSVFLAFMDNVSL